MKITRYNFLELTKDQYYKIYSLNLRKRGHGRKHLITAQKTKDNNFIFFLAERDKQILGWAMLVPCYHNDKIMEYAVNFYVRKNNRQQGIGSALLKDVIKYGQQTKHKLWAAIWDLNSETFYAKNQSQFLRIVKSNNYELQGYFPKDKLK